MHVEKQDLNFSIELSLFNKYRIWNEFESENVIYETSCVFLYPRAFGKEI